MTIWRLTVAYDGANFVGWQIQPGLRSVQSVLTAAIEAVVRHPVMVRGAGRTDSGVHAAGQVCTVATSTDRPVVAMVAGVTAHLPEDVVVLKAERVTDAFDPRHSEHTKQYRYRWLDRTMRCPMRRGQVWHVRSRLDVVAMNTATSALVGTRDFTTFRAAGCASTHPTRTLEACAVERAGDEVHLVVQGTGFLRHMIRIMAGTVLPVGRGAAPESVLAAVEARDRSAGGLTAPPQGLSMEWVAYRDDEQWLLPVE